MFVEAFPRLAIRLRSTFPDANIQLADDAKSIVIGFPASPNWEVRVSGIACREHFLCIETSITLYYECLRRLPEEDFNRFIAAENLGLRGATILVEDSKGPRTLRLRATFIGQKGRSTDEAENIAIDVISLLRFARMLEDRILRSSVADEFSFELYYSTYLSKSIGRSRYINYARNIFRGSTERVFGQVARLFKEDHKYEVVFDRGLIANLRNPSIDFEINFRIPDQIPMIACSALLHTFEGKRRDSYALASRLNSKVKFGHFEVSADGSKIFFATWKHLTNDLRLYSLDQLLHSIHEAYWILRKELAATVASPEPVKDCSEDRTAALDAYEYRPAA